MSQSKNNSRVTAMRTERQEYRAGGGANSKFKYQSAIFAESPVEGRQNGLDTGKAKTSGSMHANQMNGRADQASDKKQSAKVALYRPAGFEKGLGHMHSLGAAKLISLSAFEARNHQMRSAEGRLNGVRLDKGMSVLIRLDKGMDKSGFILHLLGQSVRSYLAGDARTFSLNTRNRGFASRILIELELKERIAFAKYVHDTG